MNYFEHYKIFLQSAKRFYFHQYFQFYILTNSYWKSPHFSSPTHHNSNQLIGFTFSIVLIIFLWLGCLKLILCLVSAWSKWGCATQFFLPKLVFMLCVCVCFFKFLEFIYFLYAIFSFLCSLLNRGNKLKLLTVTLPHVWHHVVMCTQGVSLSAVKNDTVWFHDILTNMNCPRKYSF